MNDNEILNLEVLESRLEMEAVSNKAAAPWLPIECWCNDN